VEHWEQTGQRRKSALVQIETRSYMPASQSVTRASSPFFHDMRSIVNVWVFRLMRTPFRDKCERDSEMIPNRIAG
jgi:hypothetical protein